jgi:hypothetical protein
MDTFPLDPEALAREIEIPLENWPGACHAVATAVLRRAPIPGMRLARGHWLGHVARDSVYGGGPQQHSWLVLEDGRILDPTRWCLESPKKRFIHCGVDDAYDEAGLEMRARMRPMLAAGRLFGGPARSPADAIAARLAAAPGETLARLLDAGDIDPPKSGAIDLATTERIHQRLHDPVEHHRDAAGFFGAARDLGLAALAPIDILTRVLDPAEVTVAPRANRLFAPPPLAGMTNAERLFKVFAAFLSIEERGEGIEEELAEIGLSLDDLHDALNAMEARLRVDPDLDWMASDHRITLAMAAADLLGRGFGAELRVERHAASLGLDRAALHRAMARFGDAAGYGLAWLHGREAEAAFRQASDEESMPDFGS